MNQDQPADQPPLPDIGAVTGALTILRDQVERSVFCVTLCMSLHT